MLGVSILSLPVIFLFDFETVPTVLNVFFCVFHHISYFNEVIIFNILFKKSAFSTCFTQISIDLVYGV